MPFINVKTNVSINKENQEVIKEKLGVAIKIIGKTESWLMINFEDNQKMYFRGDGDKSLAFVEVDLYGSSSDDAYNKLTGEITSILGDNLNIRPDGIYVRYNEIRNWGFNGSNF